VLVSLLGRKPATTIRSALSLLSKAHQFEAADAGSRGFSEAAAPPRGLRNAAGAPIFRGVVAASTLAALVRRYLADSRPGSRVGTPLAGRHSLLASAPRTHLPPPDRRRGVTAAAAAPRTHLPLPTSPSRAIVSWAVRASSARACANGSHTRERLAKYRGCTRSQCDRNVFRTDRRPLRRVRIFQRGHESPSASPGRPQATRLETGGFMLVSPRFRRRAAHPKIANTNQARARKIFFAPRAIPFGRHASFRAHAAR
jgi:hypothetical protein